MDPQQRLPDFLVIGAMKAGTTTLWHDLRCQPSIFLPGEKEPSCLLPKFTIEEGCRRYNHFFTAADAEQRCGEASTGYTKLPDIPGIVERAKQAIGSTLRVIYIVRDPLERLLSHHRHIYASGRAPRDVAQAVERHPELLHYSRYAMQLEPWLEAFGEQQVLVLRFEDYVADRAGHVERVCRFIGAPFDPERVEVTRAMNQSLERRQLPRLLERVRQHRAYRRWVRRSLPVETRQWLSHRLGSRRAAQPDPPSSDVASQLLADLSPDVKRLQQMLGWSELLWPMDLRERQTAS